jgi:CHAT domain-containing protein
MTLIRCIYFPFFALLLFSGGLGAVELTDQHRTQFQRCRELGEEGEWREAMEVAEELVRTFGEEVPSRHRLAFTNELANLYQRLGKYVEASRQYEVCIELANSLEGAKSLTVAQLKNNFAALKQITGDFEAAEIMSREALALREAIEGKGSVATVPPMNNLAGLLWCIGDLQASETLYRQGLEIREKALGGDHLDTARSKANLGGLLYYLNRPGEAEPLVMEAVLTFEKQAGDSHPETLEVLLFLGEIQRASGNSASARELYRRVLEGRYEVFGKSPHVEIAEAMRRMGDAERELGNYGVAIDYYRQSDEIYTEVLQENHPDRLEGLYGAGLAAFASGNSQLAKEKARELSDLEFSILEAVLAFTDERQRLAFQDLFRARNLFASLRDAESVAESLLRHKGVVIDSLIAEAMLMRNAEEGDAADSLRALAAARARFRSAFLSGGEAGLSITETESEVRELERSIRSRFRIEDAETDPFDLKLADLQASLEDETVLIDFLSYDHYHGHVEFEKRYGAAVVSRNRVAFVDCCGKESLDELLHELNPYSSGLGRMEEGDAKRALRTIHRELIEPTLPHLEGKKTLRLSPEGALNFIPFACLVDAQDRFLIEDFDIGYVSASRELIRERSEQISDAPSILVGDPGFSLDQRSPPAASSNQRGLLSSMGASTLSIVADSLTPLSGAREEVRELDAVFRKAGLETELIIGDAATEENLRKIVRRPRFLHLATHGMYLPNLRPAPGERRRDSSFVPKEVSGFQNPLFGSWLALSGSRRTVESWARGMVPDPGHDGILMANEAAELDLKGTLLVTLSACDTASGEATGGDGVLGIRRGFRKAGAQNVMTTLWPINDFMTVTLMKEFYEGLSDRTPEAALSATQRKWLVAIRDNPEAVSLPLSDGTKMQVGGFSWAVNLAGPFLLSR